MNNEILRCATECCFLSLVTSACIIVLKQSAWFMLPGTFGFNKNGQMEAGSVHTYLGEAHTGRTPPLMKATTERSKQSTTEKCVGLRLLHPWVCVCVACINYATCGLRWAKTDTGLAHASRLFLDSWGCFRCVMEAWMTEREAQTVSPRAPSRSSECNTAWQTHASSVLWF